MTPSGLHRLPSDADALLAKETGRILASHTGNESLRVSLIDSPDQGTINLPAAAVQILVRVLDEMGRGNEVTLVPTHSELTTQESADLLNISRPSLIQLLDEGRLEHRRVGTHRRIPLQAVLEYKRRAETDRKATLAELTDYDQEIGL